MLTGKGGETAAGNTQILENERNSIKKEGSLLGMEALASCFPSFVLWHQDLPSCLNPDPRSHLMLSENLLEMYILILVPYLPNLEMEPDDLRFMTGHPGDSDAR